MDLEEWELLSKNSFKDLDEDDHGDMMMDYILCPSTQDPLHKPESPKTSRMVPLQVPPIAYEPVIDHENKKIIPNNQDLEPDPDPDSSQTLLMESVPSPKVSFNKETEFVDMKSDPPVRITSPEPRIDVIAKPSDSEGGDDLQEKKVNDDDETNDQGGDQKMNLWKVGLNGIGAICSFGAAAAVASVCVFFLGHNNIKVSKNKNQTLRFQIYPDDNKRMKEVVNQATKLNETIFAMKGVPAVRAQISFGGYYDGL